jgi:hypothetical protein
LKEPLTNLKFIKLLNKTTFFNLFYAIDILILNLEIVLFLIEFRIVNVKLQILFEGNKNVSVKGGQEKRGNSLGLGNQGEGEGELEGFVMDFEALVFREQKQYTVVHHHLTDLIGMGLVQIILKKIFTQHISTLSFGLGGDYSIQLGLIASKNFSLPLQIETQLLVNHIAVG